MTAPHSYDVTVARADAAGTASYAGYARDHEVRVVGVPPIPGSSDPAFRGDARRWNPEQLQVAAVAQCHMLWYLHLAAAAGKVVTAYEDTAHGEMTLNADGNGEFTSVTLRPRVTIAEGDAALAAKLHEDVGDRRFIARSVRFPIRHEPMMRRAPR